MNFSKILASALILLTTTTAWAVPFLDIQNPNALIGSQGYAGIFNLVTPGTSVFTITGYTSGNGTFRDTGGYTRGTDLQSATASFYFADDNDTAIERVDLFIGLFNGEFDESLVNRGLTTISFGASSLSLELLETFGALNYVVKSDAGDFKLKYAMLSANTSSAPQGVPDTSSTVGLLVLALLGLFAAQRTAGRSRQS